MNTFRILDCRLRIYKRLTGKPNFNHEEHEEKSRDVGCEIWDKNKRRQKSEDRRVIHFRLRISDCRI